MPRRARRCAGIVIKGANRKIVSRDDGMLNPEIVDS
jgi:hypothetical protein